MKKFIMSAVAAGALAVGGAASAQDLGAVLTNILGFGGNVQDGAPAYVYNGSTPTGVGPFTTSVDGYGRTVLIDAYGHIVDSAGHPLVTDRYGNYVQVQPGVGNYASSRRYGDRDGDGVPDISDRKPNNPRKW